MSDPKHDKTETSHQSHRALESTKRKHFINVAIGVVIVTVLLFFLLRAGLPLPVVASEQALTIDWLFNVHMALIAFLFALVVVFMIYALVVFRRRAGDDGDGEHFEGNTPLEIAWTVIPLIVVFVFGYIGFQTLQDVTRSRDGEMTVNVRGSQWTWTFTYPDTGVVTDELVLPVNQPAVMHLEAADVIHSFWVPEFRVKQDAVPGQVQELRFTPTLEGDFEVVCAEMCGLNHYDMTRPVRIVTDAEFSAWMGEKMAEQGLQVASSQ